MIFLSGLAWAQAAPNGVSAPANGEKKSSRDASLPELGSGGEKYLNKDEGKGLKESASDYFTSSASQGFENLTPEALESQARGYVKNKVTSTTQSYVEGALSPFGKVRTNLAVSEDGDLEGSSLDYFVPWYDNQSTLLFNQFSIQRKEERTIGNIGFGVRQDVSDWLLGGNLFYDHDLSRDHRRLGVGAEAWTDYLKLSANYYHPLSDWKDSKDFDFYEERPARGWDVRSEAYLPSYPQLGGKLVYEQYYGDEVALFGKDNRQKDPHAVTLGLNYTPVPLVTVGADYKAGTGDNKSINVNAALTYQFGVPLNDQLNPDKVKSQRSLKGSRHDFVDRNNFIVLEYREKDALDVTLWLKASANNEHPECVIKDTPEAGEGLESCRWTVNALISSRYKIVSASWQAKSRANQTMVMPVIKANALTEGNNNRWDLVLPAWQGGLTDKERADRNTWLVRITMEDEKGHRVNSDPVEIVVKEDRRIELVANSVKDADEEHSHETNAQANGKDGVVLDLLVSDAFGSTTDSKGNTLEDDKMAPELYDENDKKVKLSTTPCDVQAPCVFILDRNEEAGTVTVASTLPGVFRWKAKAAAYGESNYVDVAFDDTSLKELKPVIYQLDSGHPVNLIGNNDRLALNKTYRFMLWRDANGDGAFQLSERVSDEEMAEYEYKWEFTGQSAHGETGAQANTENEDLVIPETNHEAAAAFGTREGGDGVQGYGLRVLYRKKSSIN
nr:intimin-like inverse autotransporter SinH [Leminorella grimontii]